MQIQIQNPADLILWTSVPDPKLIISDPDPKLIISDPDPDPQIENQEFRIRIQIRILDPDPSVTWDGEKKSRNFGYYEDTNGLKSWTF